MGYSTGLLRRRVTVAKRMQSTTSAFGKDAAGITYETIGTFWADVTWTKGVKAMREGALDAYDIIMIRMRFQSIITRECLMQFEGKWYDIESFHWDYQENIIQVTARERANQDITLNN